jgi:hypothetical protein
MCRTPALLPPDMCACKSCMVVSHAAADAITGARAAASRNPPHRFQSFPVPAFCSRCRYRCSAPINDALSVKKISTL